MWRPAQRQDAGMSTPPAGLQVQVAVTPTPTMDLPGHRLVIKHKSEDAAVMQLWCRHTSLLQQLRHSLGEEGGY